MHSQKGLSRFFCNLSVPIPNEQTLYKFKASWQFRLGHLLGQCKAVNNDLVLNTRKLEQNVPELAKKDTSREK